MTGASLASLSRDPCGDVHPTPAVSDSPERRLLRAILQQALCDALALHGLRLRPRRVCPGVAADALRWLASESEAPSSFRWTCAHLGLSPERIRCRLRSSVATAAEAVAEAGSERAA